MGLAGMFIILIIVGCLTGGIGFFVYYILLEMAHISQYALATTVLFVTIIELIRFVLHVFFNTNLDLNPKIIFQKIKSLFKRNKKNNDQTNNTKKTYTQELNKYIKTEKDKVIIIIEFIILIIFAIYSFVKPPHSILLNFIYSSLVARLLYGVFIPLLIINAINSSREEGFGWLFIPIFMEFVFGIILATTLVFAADVVEKDSPKGKEVITSWFTYDNNSYDKIRKEENIIDKYEFLKTKFNNALDTLYKEYDVNNKEDYDSLKKEIFKKVDIVKYGFKITDSFWVDDNIVIVYIVDGKTNVYDFYKLNCRTRSFEKSSMDEWKEAKQKK